MTMGRQRGNREMTREEKRRRTILRAMVALVDDEQGELEKLRRLRTTLYWAGAAGVGLAVAAGGWSGWLAVPVAAVGGLLLGLGAHYDNSLNQWPTLRAFVDFAAVRRAAATLDD
jgi:hypothetical protein